MVINVHAGHNHKVPGASGYFSETVEDRNVKNEVIKLLRAFGHTAYDCTDESGATQSENLKNIVSKCNAHSAELDVSIHFNAFNGSANGVEVLVYSASSKAKDGAQRICDKIAALGFSNRGVKVRNNLYVLSHTKAPALLVECCFCDSGKDAALYHTETMAKAIVEGILAMNVSLTPVQPSGVGGTSAAQPKKSNWVSRLQTECNVQGFSKQKVDGIPGPKTLAGCPTCRKGARGNITRLLQEKLNNLGYDCGAVDGIFGAKTKAAVMAFQRAKGLVIDGIVGKNTWRKLIYV